MRQSCLAHFRFLTNVFWPPTRRSLRSTLAGCCQAWNEERLGWFTPRVSLPDFVIGEFDFSGKELGVEQGGVSTCSQSRSNFAALLRSNHKGGRAFFISVKTDTVTNSVSPIAVSKLPDISRCKCFAATGDKWTPAQIRSLAVVPAPKGNVSGYKSIRESPPSSFAARRHPGSQPRSTTHDGPHSPLAAEFRFPGADSELIHTPYTLHSTQPRNHTFRSLQSRSSDF
jgi:hypothetical protein